VIGHKSPLHLLTPNAGEPILKTCNGLLTSPEKSLLDSTFTGGFFRNATCSGTAPSLKPKLGACIVTAGQCAEQNLVKETEEPW